MSEPVISRAEIAAQAAADAKAWIEAGAHGAPMNPYPALSEAAKLYDIAFRRNVTGAADEVEASA